MRAIQVSPSIGEGSVQQSSEPASCLLCGCKDSRPYLEVKGWTYRECLSCHSFFIPREKLEEHSAFFSDPDYRLRRILTEARHGRLRDWHLRLMQSVQPLGRVLEVGCSGGFFLRTMQDAGYVVRGIDLGAECAIFGKTFLGVEIETRDFLEWEGQVDWVVMHQVIEHVPDPTAFIRKAHELLAPGGRLLITTPNLSFARRLAALTGNRVLGDALGHPPSHCILFEPNVLAKALQQQGFKIERLGHNPTGFEAGTGLRLMADRLLMKFAAPIGPNFYIIGRKS
jgi:2-polyprenyl-3-methyl-5-hydroxy-6-metoxy-1,4-benzoquinol methylase